ncbi:unnamed protein product [Prunus armeniaca]|uniref:Uncharacterized protein n=1 Tax=Prunus armeniaca TaxID=36596 RepID=A0A6J5WGE1_PRUAR|nr:unnamed protein product [Prunus armeniaca]
MRTGIKVDSQKGSEILLKIYNNTTPSTNTKPQRVPSSNPTTKAFLLQNPKPKNSTVMSTPIVPDAYVLASLMESHFKELDLIPELFLLNNEEMLFILEKCFSHSCLEKAIAEKIAVDKSDSADQINPSPVDSALLKDCVAQVRVASKKRFIKIVHCYLLKAGKEKEAQEYLEKVSPASRVDHLESVKMWNYLTLPFQVLKVMEDMGLGTSPLSFSMPPAPPEVFPTPARGWRPGQATAHGNIPGPRIRGLIDSFINNFCKNFVNLSLLG